ncbi:MAG: hypothetical protein IJS54_07510 [Desulfovibrio sp.]|nr:hypothetical protein [Desulfovibrio sp.]
MGETTNTPHYELRAWNHGVGNLELVIWQMPCEATPHVTEPIRIAGLKGRNMAFVEDKVLRTLKREGIDIGPAPKKQQTVALNENLAMSIGLLFRVLAPMRNAERMRLLTSEIEHMDKEEIAYWLGMAMHRRNPRRVLCALRILLTAPKDN